ncbi:MAG: GatB/YqeY domain-containing protein [Prevotella sp.]|nr:GatB/YqeY domain-containing protein [Prevotella sp.]MCI5854660.1 GatB/YqeY domain-containing protein [Prevotella sp.]MDD6737075.1 GatB/YqeY domain-containing protein [Prevotella sp.]MDY6091642.1 GatB/YqeY domain-containing protein [Prevotella sp.]
MTLFDQISNDIIAAMKAKEKERLSALRNIKKIFIEAKTAPGANDTLTDDTALKLLQKLAKQGRDSATLYQTQNRPDLAEAELVQVAVIEEYLPKALTPEEIEEAVRTIITETGAQSIKDMGRVMSEANKRLAGRADGKAISEVVKRLLA